MSSRLRDLTAWAFPGQDPKSPEAVVHWLALERTLQLLDAALPGPALLVKGAALALTVYATPTERPMSDVDVLIARELLDGAAAALASAGFRSSPHSRPHTMKDLELQMFAPMAGVSILVELHASLDKVASRPVDYAAILDRSSSIAGFKRLRVPSAEDHLLLLALHLAVDDFGHRPGFADLALLIEQGLDFDVVLDRARAWRLESVLALTLQMLEARCPETAPAAVLEKLEGRRAVRWVQRRFFSPPADVPAARTLGLPWIARQTLLHDDLGTWSLGLARYAAKRVVERWWVSRDRRRSRA